jgi:hypothetical protein
MPDATSTVLRPSATEQLPKFEHLPVFAIAMSVRLSIHSVVAHTLADAPVATHP